MEQKAKEAASHAAIPVSISAMLVTLGVVYGDIGTSPMYVTKALVAGNGGIGSVTEEFVLGALSLVVWTVTLLTTIKYVLISLRADNHGEGGIFALYSLVKRCGKWLIIPAMLGGAALARRRHPDAGRYRYHGHRGPAHHPGGPCRAGR